MKFVGYMNLIQTEVVLNDETQPFLGIGNVCSLKKGLGYGRELLIGVQNIYLKITIKESCFAKISWLIFTLNSNGH